MAMRIAPALLIVGLCFSGCHQALPYRSRAAATASDAGAASRSDGGAGADADASADAGPLADSGSLDGGRDGAFGTADVFLTEAGVSSDAAVLADAGSLSDAGGPPIDASALADTGALTDAADRPDSSTDPGVDASASATCAAIAVLRGSLQVGNTQLVFCEGLESISQCNAQSLCADGWRLCPASTYRSEFSASPPPLAGAWIAGCVRDGPDPFAEVQDGVCTCERSRGAKKKATFARCDAPEAVLDTDSDHMGVVSDSTCRLLGSALTDGAHWYAHDALTGDGVIKSAVCCR